MAIVTGILAVILWLIFFLNKKLDSRIINWAMIFAVAFTIATVTIISK